jgi:hypothetical protein
MTLSQKREIGPQVDSTLFMVCGPCLGRTDDLELSLKLKAFHEQAHMRSPVPLLGRVFPSGSELAKHSLLKNRAFLLKASFGMHCALVNQLGQREQREAKSIQPTIEKKAYREENPKIQRQRLRPTLIDVFVALVVLFAGAFLSAALLGLIR